MRDYDEPRLPMWHYGFLGFAAVMILLTNVVAHRSILLSNVPDVAHLADLPPKAATVALDRMTWAAFLPTSRLRPELAAQFLTPEDATTPKLGYSVRQVTFLGLPFWAYREVGEVLYTRSPNGFTLHWVGDEPVAALEEASGEKIAVGTFPFWLYGWGWLAVLAVALFGWFEWRNQVSRREILGLL